MRSKITSVLIKFGCENAAFDEDNSEIADILAKISNSFRNSIYPEDVPEIIMDSNGNRVGKIELETEEVEEDE